MALSLLSSLGISFNILVSDSRAFRSDSLTKDNEEPIGPGRHFGVSADRPALSGANTVGSSLKARACTADQNPMNPPWDDHTAWYERRMLTA